MSPATSQAQISSPATKKSSDTGAGLPYRFPAAWLCFYYGNQPAHVGVMLNPAKCLHSRGEFGFVRTDSAVILQKIYNKVEYLVHGSI
ncbi:Uncharacterised protein [Raoultella ornithinolytica]|nr:Uncharacterised protein [Raoultella ornithinolytica]